MKKHLLVFISLLSSLNFFAQSFTLENEVTLFTFKTKNGKTASLSKDRNDKYIVYRFGTPNKIELEYPEKDSQSWKKFKFNSYVRGGGKSNDGMEVYDVMFENNGFQYVLYQSYHAEDEQYNAGIYVLDTKNDKTVKIEGIYEYKEGGLSIFKYEKLLENEDFGLFD